MLIFFDVGRLHILKLSSRVSGGSKLDGVYVSISQVNGAE
jgi:hypothetical protein